LQKLITIYLKDIDGCGDFIDSGETQEHIGDYLSDGWIIKNLTTLSGNGGGETEVSAGWVVVVIEKP